MRRERREDQGDMERGHTYTLSLSSVRGTDMESVKEKRRRKRTRGELGKQLEKRMKRKKRGGGHREGERDEWEVESKITLRTARILTAAGNQLMHSHTSCPSFRQVDDGVGSDEFGQYHHHHHHRRRRSRHKEDE